MSTTNLCSPPPAIKNPTIAPKAPPVPPPKANMKSITSKRSNSNQFAIDECLWAVKYPELQKACYLANICTSRPARKCQYRNVAGILQVGPTCGLTAISMLLNGLPTAEDLLDTARSLNYTNNGEMFSAQNLYKLICDTLQRHANNNNIIEKCGNGNENSSSHICKLHEGRLKCAKVMDALLAGACIFVPYDSDYNHAPCLKHGRKAHWALIIGYLIADTDEFYVIARHGKTKNIAVWSLDDLSKSNESLIVFEQPSNYPDCDFILPPGGIGGDFGLRERAIIVYGITNEIVTIE